MFGALGFFGSIDDERNKPDMFGAEGFFGAGGGAPPVDFFLRAEDGTILRAEDGTPLESEH